ncbi:hypothetical protein GGI12_004594 [Dipsacomyces acuminosporus]|nr:hypothetical protein GGI12_004594 [Dipsacomyces acuminosporus]
MVSVASVVFVIAALASGFQLAFAESNNGILYKRDDYKRKEGDTCDITKDRFACMNEQSLLLCNQNVWAKYSDCNPGTHCLNGECAYDGATSTAAAPSAPQQQPSQSLMSGPSGAAKTSPDAYATSAAPSASQPISSAPPYQTGGGNGGNGGNNFGITCQKFNQAVSAASKAIGNNYPAPSAAQCSSFLKGMKPAGSISSGREAAMFLANILWESDGLRAKEEYACRDMPDWCAQNYKTPEDTPGQTYWGRGYIQLSWHYNYLDASKELYGDDRLVKNTQEVSKDEDVAWNVSFWFWKDRVRSDPGVQAGKFGASINKINGALECRGAAQDKAKKRYEMYKAILPIFAPGETPIESGCYN